MCLKLLISFHRMTSSYSSNNLKENENSLTSQYEAVTLLCFVLSHRRDTRTLAGPRPTTTNKRYASTGKLLAEQVKCGLRFYMIYDIRTTGAVRAMFDTTEPITSCQSMDQREEPDEAVPPGAWCCDDDDAQLV